MGDAMTGGKNGITYADAGVDIDAGNALVERIKPAAKRTARPGVMAGLGGFGALGQVDIRNLGDHITGAINLNPIALADVFAPANVTAFGIAPGDIVLILQRCI